MPQEPPFSPTATLLTSSRAWDAALTDALKPLGLTTRKYGLLGHIRGTPGISFSDLARRSRITVRRHHEPLPLLRPGGRRTRRHRHHHRRRRAHRGRRVGAAPRHPAVRGARPHRPVVGLLLTGVQGRLDEVWITAAMVLMVVRPGAAS